MPNQHHTHAEAPPSANTTGQHHTQAATPPLYRAPSPLLAVRTALHAQYIEGWIATRTHAQALEQVLAGEVDDATAVDNALHESLRLGEIDSLPPKSLWQRIVHRAPYEDDRYPILRNRPNIASPTALRAAESAIASLRAAQYLQRQWYPATCDDIVRLHEALFEEIYPWAGQRRIVELTKGDTSFCPTANFAEVEAIINSLLERWLCWQPGMGFAAERLAELTAWMIWWHPAREGNGRTTMIALCALAHARGITLRLDHIHREEWMRASREALSGAIPGRGIGIDSTSAPGSDAQAQPVPVLPAGRAPNADPFVPLVQAMIAPSAPM